MLSFEQIIENFKFLDEYLCFRHKGDKHSMQLELTQGLLMIEDLNDFDKSYTWEAAYEFLFDSTTRKNPRSPFYFCFKDQAVDSLNNCEKHDPSSLYRNFEQLKP